MLDDVQAAFKEARETARDVAAQAIAQKERSADFCVEIQDLYGRIIASLPVKEICSTPAIPSWKMKAAAAPQTIKPSVDVERGHIVRRQIRPDGRNRS